MPDDATPSTTPPPQTQPRPTPARSVRSSSTALLWVLLFLLLILVSPYLIERIQFALVRGRATAEAEVAREKLAQMPAHAISYADVAKAIGPSVVGVETTRIVNGEQPDEFSWLLQRRGRPFRAEGEGSGVIVDDNGYIITNFHVIDGAAEVAVKLPDGRTVRQVEVVGADPASDIALLKIPGDSLMAAEWGDSGELLVGEPVLAVGSPFGLEQTVTAGIVSAKGRRGVVGNINYQDFLQTDAAVNPGNSGGPLVDLEGKVVGINTAIVGPAYQGISFAIPSRLARDVYEKLRETGTVERGWLGVSIQPISEPIAERLGLDSTDGALVADVIPGAPAAAAGIEPGDVITRWNDIPIAEPADLTFAVAATEIGSTATVELLRDGESRTFDVTVGLRPVQVTR